MLELTVDVTILIFVLFHCFFISDFKDHALSLKSRVLTERFHVSSSLDNFYFSGPPALADGVQLITLH